MDPLQTRLPSRLTELADNDLNAYGEEIRRLRGRIAYLESQRERLNDRKTKLSSLCSPARRLPSDVLMEIFVQCCPENDFSQFDVLPPAMTLASVCSRWREVAVGCPRMWSSLAVDLDTGRREYHMRLKAALEIYLPRSKQHPLDLTFKHPSFLSLPAHRIPLLLQQFPRWRTITIPSDSALMRYRVPFEENWMLSAGSFDFDPMSNKSYATDLSCSVSGLQVLVYRMCPNVKHSLLKNSYQEHSSTRQGFEASSIRTLSVDRLDDLDLCSLTMPNLDGLELDLLPDPSSLGSSKSPPTIISTFLTRSKCLLTSLSLNNVFLTDTELIAVLTPLKSLTRLMISDSNSSNSVIARPLTKVFVESLHEYRRTSLHAVAQPILPKLRYLTLKPSSTNSNADFVDAFVETVRSRWCPLDSSEDLAVDRLWSVELHLAADVDATAYCNQLSFERPAMRVVVKGPRGYLL